MPPTLRGLFRRSLTKNRPAIRSLPGDVLSALVVDTAPMGIFHTDARGNCRFVNERWCHFTGVPSEQAGGQGWVLAVHPDDRAEFFAAWARAVETKADFSLEYRLRRPDGQFTWVSAHGVPVLDDHGALTGFVGTVIDIAERRAAEQALRDSESRLRAIFTVAVDGIITIDSAGVIRSFNPAASRIFGWSADEAVGRPVSMLMPEPSRTRHQGYVEHLLAGGPPRVIGFGREALGLRKDGSVFPLELAVSEFCIAGERMFAGIARDVTERKQIDRMKDEFIAVVSHELRTPLTSISGAVALLNHGAGGTLSDESKALIDVAHRNCTRLVEQLNAIIDMENLSAGRVSFRDDRLDLADLVERTVDAFRFRGGGVSIALQAGVRPGLAFVEGDSTYLIQALGNLLSNAVKYSPIGEEIEIDVIPCQGWWRVAVTDHGRGVPKRLRARMFQRFAQNDILDASGPAGIGLGLAIAQAIVARHGGHIGFDSEERRGATFWFELPAFREAKEAAPARIRPAARMSARGYPGFAEAAANAEA